MTFWQNVNLAMFLITSVLMFRWTKRALRLKSIPTFALMWLLLSYTCWGVLIGASAVNCGIERGNYCDRLAKHCGGNLD